MSNLQKPERNSLIHWWNELLFARYFEYETDNDPYEVAYQLKKVAYKDDAFLWVTTQETKINFHPNGKGLDFDVQRKMRRRADIIPLLTARAQGIAHVDSATGRTKVSGTIKLGRFFHFYLLFLVFYVVFIGTRFLPLMLGLGVYLLPVLLALMTVPLILGLYWHRIYSDRNDLAAQIAQAIMEKRKRTASRLEVDMNLGSDIRYADDLQEARHKSDA